MTNGRNAGMFEWKSIKYGDTQCSGGNVEIGRVYHYGTNEFRWFSYVGEFRHGISPTLAEAKTAVENLYIPPAVFLEQKREIERLRAEVASLRVSLGQSPARDGAEPIGCPCPGACSAVAPQWQPMETAPRWTDRSKACVSILAHTRDDIAVHWPDARGLAGRFIVITHCGQNSWGNCMGWAVGASPYLPERLPSDWFDLWMPLPKFETPSFSQLKG